MRQYRRIVIGSVLLVASCGPAGSSEGENTAAELRAGTSASLVASEGDRPGCDEASENQLIYVLASKQFQTCSQGDWVVLDIAGPAGKDGRDGTDGQDGTDGADGQDGSFSLNRVWRDPVSGQQFIYTGIAVAGLNANNRCPAGWRLPTLEEALEAFYAGLHTDTVETLGHDSNQSVAHTIVYGDTSLTDYREIQLWEATMTDPTPDMSKYYKVFCTLPP